MDDSGIQGKSQGSLLFRNVWACNSIQEHNVWKNISDTSGSVISEDVIANQKELTHNSYLA